MENSLRILVTPTSIKRASARVLRSLESGEYEVRYNETGRPLKEAELRNMLRDVDGYIAGVDEVTENCLAEAARLRVIARYGAGVDNVNLAAAKARGIVVTHTPGANAVSVAELTVGLILSLLRHIPEAVTMTKSGNWARISGLALKGKTVGIVGAGSIGRELAKRLSAFDCMVLGVDPFADWLIAADHGIKQSGLETLLMESDVVSLHLPGSPENRGMVNGEFLARMKTGAFLINTARGDLIDETALLEALDSGRLSGAAIDVFSTEPPTGSERLLVHPNVLATPHMGAHTDDAIDRMAACAIGDCLSVLHGMRPMFPVPEV